jgi:hypothetical protein
MACPQEERVHGRGIGYPRLSEHHALHRPLYESEWFLCSRQLPARRLANPPSYGTRTFLALPSWTRAILPRVISYYTCEMFVAAKSARVPRPSANLKGDG